MIFYIIYTDLSNERKGLKNSGKITKMVELN